MINIRKLEAELWESADLLRAGSKLTITTVMGEDRLEVVWKFGDVYKKILGEMR